MPWDLFVLFVEFCHVLQVLHNGQVLGANCLALAAFQALIGTGKLACQRDVFSMPGLSVLLLPIIQREQAGDGDTGRASVHTVIASGTGDRHAAVDQSHRTADNRMLLLGEGFSLYHVGCIIRQLFHIAHVGEHHKHALQICRKANGPG